MTCKREAVEERGGGELGEGDGVVEKEGEIGEEGVFRL